MCTPVLAQRGVEAGVPLEQDAVGKSHHVLDFAVDGVFIPLGILYL
jgi:hypothetical protein